MQETVLRMNEKNVRYQAENKALKQDLEKLMNEVGMGKEKQGEDFIRLLCRGGALVLEVGIPKNLPIMIFIMTVSLLVSLQCRRL